MTAYLLCCWFAPDSWSGLVLSVTDESLVGVLVP
jgi:uncharacterized membrane-anchored protein YjiN (DUF445 family)